MRNSVILTAAILSAPAVSAAPPASANDGQADIKISCDASSQYQVSMSGQAFVFENDTGRNTRVALGGGDLFINGKKTALSPADQQRIDDFESELRLLVPEARKVVSEAVNIAFDALTEVAVAMSGKPAKRGEFDAARAEALAAANDPESVPIFNEQSLQDIVDPIVSEFLPDIMGSAIGFAMKAMFAGEEKARDMEARMDAMDKTMEARIEARADALEPLAEGMCKRIQRMEAIDAALSVRLPDGRPINFLDTQKAH